ncbi:MAG: GIY-YIG nuclease family protein [Actinopolymorphaceae bacterium]
MVKPESESCSLYRFYDREGDLLYVGITKKLPRRLREHEIDKAWWTEVQQVTINHFETRDRALEAEAGAIYHEQPRWNVHGRRKPEPLVEILPPQPVAVDGGSDDVEEEQWLDWNGNPQADMSQWIHVDHPDVPIFSSNNQVHWSSMLSRRELARTTDYRLLA